MKNIELWKPTKFLLTNGKPKANGKNIYPGSFIFISILAKKYFSVIKMYAKGRLLDLGCGNVPLYEFYKDITDEVVCVDWENSFHENKFLDYQFNLNLPFPKNLEKFDTIITTDVLEHIEEPNVFFSEIVKLLKDDGKLILSTPFLYWIHEAPYDYYRYTEFKLRNLCKQNNLEIIQLKPYGGINEVLADLIAKSFANRRFVIKIYNKTIPMLLKIFSQKQSSVFPLGYILIAQKIDETN